MNHRREWAVKFFLTYYLQKYIDFFTIDTLLSRQTLMSGWWAEPVAVLAQWRWKIWENGEQCTVLAGLWDKQLFSVNIWAVALLFLWERKGCLTGLCGSSYMTVFSLRLLWENEQHHRPLSIPWISPAQVSPLVTSAMTSVLIVHVFNTYVVCSWGNADRCSSKPRCHFCKEKKQTAWRRRQQKHRHK